MGSIDGVGDIGGMGDLDGVADMDGGGSVRYGWEWGLRMWIEAWYLAYFLKNRGCRCKGGWKSGNGAGAIPFINYGLGIIKAS